MIKTKVKIVGDLITKCIVDNTLSCKQVFQIFDPYVEFTASETPTAYAYTCDDEPPNYFTITENAISTTCRELGLLKFKINKKFNKKIRTFNINSRMRYSLWLSNSWKTKTNQLIQSELIFCQGILVTSTPNGPGMYHFLREMKKLVPTCVTDLEKLMLMNL